MSIKEQGSSLIQALNGLARALTLFFKSRLETFFGWGWATAVGCLIEGRGFPNLFKSIFAVTTVTTICICIYQYNDIVDSKIDSLNPKKSQRPVSSGKVSHVDAMRLVYVSGALSIILSYFLGPVSFSLCMIFLGIAISYSYPRIRLKSKFLLKELTVASGSVLTTLIGGSTISGGFSVTTLFASVISSLFIFLSYPAMADSFDVREDRAYGIKTMASILSWRKMMQMAILATFIVMTLTPITYSRLGFNTLLPIVVVGLSLVFLRYMFPIMLKFEEKSLVTARKMGAIYLIVLQVAFVIGALRI